MPSNLIHKDRFVMKPRWPNKPGEDKVYLHQSEDQEPFGFLSFPTKIFTIPATPRATGPVDIIVTARADLIGAGKHVRVELNGTQVGDLFIQSAGACGGPGGSDTEVVTLSASQFNSHIMPDSDSLVTLRMVGGFTAPCPNSFANVAVQYPYITNPQNTGKPAHLIWQTYDETIIDAFGDFKLMDGEWQIDRLHGHIVVQHEEGFRQTLSGLGPAIETMEDGRQHRYLASPTTGELFGVIVEFSSSASCPNL